MRFTLFQDLAALEARPMEMTWDELRDWIANPTVYPSKSSMPLIKLGSFGDLRTRSGCLRHDANLLCVAGCEGDYDGGVMTMNEAADRLADAGVTSLLYTSPSHHPDRPRWRVLCPLSREHPPETRRMFLGRVNGVLGGVLSSESFTASQAFYVGRLEGADYAVR